MELGRIVPTLAIPMPLWCWGSGTVVVGTIYLIPLWNSSINLLIWDEVVQLNRSTDNIRNLKIDNRDLEYVDRFKYLGILLDRRLNFRLHHREIMKRLNDKIFLLCKIRKFINTFTAVIIFKSYILSYLEYGTIFLDCIPLNLKNKRQRLQIKSLRVCHLRDRHMSNFELHQVSRVLPLRIRRKMSICSLMFRKVHENPAILYIPGRLGNRS